MKISRNIFKYLLWRFWWAWWAQRANFIRKYI